MVKLIVFVCLVILSFSAFSENGHKKGKVQYLRVHDEAEHPNWAPPIFWFTLEGVTSAGTCKVWNGNVLFVMDSDAALSLILAAEMGDKELVVRFDDTKLNKDNNWCKATYVTLGDPGILK
jgi:hypothetical protein